MAAAFFIALREGLEAALIVGIIAAYLVRTGRSDVLPRILAGVGAAVALSIGLGVTVVITIGRLPAAVQETFEGVASLVAVAFVTWMLFWMRRQGRAIKADLESQVSAALARGTTAALVGIAFVAVIREGLETTLFFLAFLSSRGDTVPALLGGLAGLVAAAALGWAIFWAGIRINLRRFFTATGVILIFVAAGLVVYAIQAFTEAGILAQNPYLWDMSGMLTDRSALGTVLGGLFGYRAAPTALQVTGYLLYLVPVLALFLFDDRLPFRRRVARA